MINILIPLAGRSQIFEGQFFPKPFFEINDHIMIEYPIAALNRITEEKRFIFVLRHEDCVKFHLDKTIELLTSPNTVIIRQIGDTKGAVCTCLLAIDHINNDDPLIISNADQYLDVDYNQVLAHFRKHKAQGGLVCFDSVHPQWSYAKLDKEDNIIQTAEKQPLSRHAIAGFYYFEKGKYFVTASERSLEHEAHCNGLYYTAPIYNELLLEGLSLKAYHVPKEKYHSFYSFSKIRDFEKQNVKI